MIIELPAKVQELFLTNCTSIITKTWHTRIFLQNFIFIQGNSTALCFPRFLLSYKSGKIEKLKDTKILKYKKGKKQRYILFDRKVTCDEEEREGLEGWERRGMTDGESRKRHRNRNLLLQITTSLRLLFLLLLPIRWLDVRARARARVCVCVCVCARARIDFYTCDSLGNSRNGEVRIRKFTTFCCHFSCLLTAQLTVYVWMNVFPVELCINHFYCETR